MQNMFSYLPFQDMIQTFLIVYNNYTHTNVLQMFTFRITIKTKQINDVFIG